MEQENNIKSFSEEIEDLYKLHYVTKLYEHYIRINPETLKLFEATKFVYAYFAFNSFYNYDWETSVKENKLIDFEWKTFTNEKGEEKPFGDSIKFKRMSDFIISLMDESDKNEFFKMVTKLNRTSPNYDQKVREMIRDIDSITEDSRIKESEREAFKNSFKILLETKDINKGKFKNDILRFVYLVRNNIFHGTKNTIQMSERGQRRRLEIYANILIATNEMLFRILKRREIFTPESKYKIQIN